MRIILRALIYTAVSSMIFFKRLSLLFFLCWPLITSATMQTAEQPEPRQSLESQFERGVWLLNQQQWQAAVSVFNQLLDENPQWVEAQNNLAVALLKSGDIDAAREALEQAVVALPNFKIAQQNRQRLYDYLAANAYDQALGKNSKRALPDLSLLTWQPEKIVETPKLDNRASIQQQIKNWAEAWSSGNADKYFSVYAKNFQPQANIAKNYKEWHRSRLVKLNRADKPFIEIKRNKIFLNVKQNAAIAEFVQHYQAKHYADTVIKQLSFVLQDGVWLIQSERVLEQLSR